ncbi:MAG: VTT domain-containing protein [Longimicrobiales bacterium]|nr:VTT domain-containing protein [Longimicrobiales bacterium]
MAEVAPEEPAPSGSSKALVKLGLLVALVAGGLVAANATPLDQYFSREGIGQAIDWIRASEAAPVLYMILYASATALAIPGSILTLAGGALFGVVWGTVYTTIAANVGANLAFGVARFLGRDGIRKLAGSRLDRLDQAAEEHGFRGLFTLRLIPVIPFNALNFGAGLTSISWGNYALATAIGIFPGTVVYTMFADALLAGSQEASREALIRVLVSGGLLILLSFLPTIARRLGIELPGSQPGSGTSDGDASSGGGGAAGPLSLGLVLAMALAPGDASTQALPSHEAFGALLAEVVEQPLVDYAELVERKDALDDYIATLSAVDPTALAGSERDARLAFWINAYNACMLKLVAEHYPIEGNSGFFSSIRNSLAGRPDNSVWQIDDVFTRRHCPVAGADRSQDEIEHEIIRPTFDEPRIHFAVNCAARSCPVLWPEAYTAQRLDEQLDRAVRNLVENPEHFRVEGATVRMNKVLDWYKDDFGGIDGLRSFFAPYLSEQEAEVLTDPGTQVAFFDYDWTLNDTGS